MWLRLCIILVVLRMGLKVNVMRITLQYDFIYVQECMKFMTFVTQ